MRPMLYPTPFRALWRPVMARVYSGLLPDRMDDLNHAELHRLFIDLERISG